ncbi:hypothetical protein BH23BAC1_BH23BAC1_34070 [soil metagenome]
MGKSLTSTAGKMIWRSLGPKTKWKLIKVTAPILTAALMRSISRNSQKFVISGAILAGTVVAMIILNKNK